MPDESFRSQAQVLVERLRPVVAPGAVATPREPEPAWTAEVMNKSFWQLALQVRLTHAQHLITYSINVFASTLQVDGVGVWRGSEPGEKMGKPCDEIPFQLSDGDAVRQCTLLVYFPVQKARAALTVDGRLLYDGPQASRT